MKKGLFAVIASALVMLAAAPSAFAGDTPCVGALTGTFDNVVVPPGATCVLTNSIVRGNVKALENSQLNFGNNEIRQDVIGDKAERVDSLDPGLNRIGGNVDVKEGDVDDPLRDFDLINDTVQGDVKVEKMTGDIDVESSTIRNGDLQVFQSPVTGTFVGLDITGTSVPNGSVQLFENQIAFQLNLQFNQIGSDGQVFKNGGPGAKRVQFNNVRENLQCKENATPFVGQPNVVGGNAEDQCAQGSGPMSLRALPEEPDSRR